MCIETLLNFPCVAGGEEGRASGGRAMTQVSAMGGSLTRSPLIFLASAAQ